MSVETAIACDVCGQRWSVDDVVTRAALYMRSGFGVDAQVDICADCLASLRRGERWRPVCARCAAPGPLAPARNGQVCCEACLTLEQQP